METPYPLGLLPNYWLFHLNLTYFCNFSHYPYTDNFQISCLISISRYLSWFPQRVEFCKKSHSASPILNASSPPKLFVLNSSCAPGKGTNADPCLKPETKVFFFLGSHILLTYLLLSLVQVPSALSPKITTLLTTLPGFILIPSNPLSTMKSQYCFKITCDYVTSLFNIFQGFPTPRDRLVTP